MVFLLHSKTQVHFLLYKIPVLPAKNVIGKVNEVLSTNIGMYGFRLALAY